jgi:genome maintenance exonuclease 1
MYIPKFDYKNLSRTTDTNGKRLYQTPDGHRVPSVTTILSATQPEEKKQSLQNWRKSIGADRAQAITTEAANRGTRMHKYLEDYIRNGVISERGSNPYSWASHKMAQTIIEDGLKNVNEVWGVEIPLYFPQLYAGTTDGCGMHMGDESILDYKQTNKPKKLEWIDDYFLQLVAYSEAHNEIYGTKIRKGVILMCVKPDVDKETLEPLTRPQYQEFILQGTDYDKYVELWWQRLEKYYMLSN